MDFLQTYQEDIKAFIEAVIELFKTIFGLLGSDNAEDGTEESTQAK